MSSDDEQTRYDTEDQRSAFGDRGPTYRFRLKDRRRQPTPLFSRYMFWGRRRSVRRGYEKGGYYVDGISTTYWLYGGVIVALSLMDSILTLLCLSLGLEEANPVMAKLLGVGPLPFLSVKFAITAFGTLILVRHEYFKYVNWVIAAVIMVFIAVVVNNLRLLLVHL